ncbi:MAG: efflux RND transporter permease subunit [Acutalibacteraceae bacterium]|nr:efflux RND transporter permease subunit [Acutalibacteraceae bacterium]
MLSKFSVKKPFTVLVAVILVIVLGIVSFMKMTPNLLPNMDFPYMVIITTYPGASPELVETTVSKPLEQSVSVLDGVKTVTSSSSDNYSMVMVEFEDGTNMDSAVVDVSGKIDMLEGVWDDTVGTPTIMEINPDMMPASVVAIDVEDMDTVELTEYLNDELLNQLEGVEGVATITSVGAVEEDITVTIDHEKLENVNKKVRKAINSKFDEGIDELNDALAHLNDGLDQVNDGQKQIDAGKTELETERQNAYNQLVSAESTLDQKQAEILNGKIELIDTIDSLNSQRTELQSNYQKLAETQTVILDLKINIQDINNTIVQLTAYQATINDLNALISTLDPESDEYKEAYQQLKGIEAGLSAIGISSEELPQKIEELNATLTKLEESYATIVASLAEQKISEETLQIALDEMLGGISKLDIAIEQLNTTLKQLEDGQVTLNSAMAELSKQKLEAEYKLNSAYVELRVNEVTLSNTKSQLESNKTELEKSLDTVNEQQETTQEKSDVTKIITMEMVSSILTAQNFSMPAGYITEEKEQHIVRVGDKITDLEELNELLLFDLDLDDVDPIYLKDVAKVEKSDNSNEVYAKINGNNGLMLSFTKSSESAVATVCENIEKELEAIKAENKKFNYTVLMDQGTYIDLVINNVLSNLLVGAVFAIIVLLLFLKDIKPTFIVACSIPLSVVFAIVLMYFSGVTLNIISLSGLAVGVGMLVDNSVVVIENVYRLRSLGIPAVKAAVNGARQVAGAITASTLTTICVFLPIVFVEGLTRQIFADLALTIAYSLIASLVVALTLVPAMGKSLFKNTKERKHRFMDMLIKVYDKTIRFTLSHRALAVILSLIMLIGSITLGLTRGFSFMPNASSAEIQVNITMPKGSELEDTVKMSENILEIINKSDKYKTVGAMVGNSNSMMGMGSTDNGSSMLYLVLKDEYAKDSEAIANNLKKQIEDKKYNAEITVSGGMMGSMESLMGSGVGVTVYCDDLDKLQKTANDIEGIIKAVDGIDKTDNGIADVTTEIRITVDKEKAMKHSLTVAQVFQQVNEFITSEKTSTSLSNSDGSSLDVVVIDNEKSNIKAEELLDKEITYTDKEGNEKSIELGEIASITKADAMTSISRENQRRYLTVTGEISPEYTVTDVSNRVKAAVEKYEHSSDVTIDFTGENESTMESVYDLCLMMLLGVIFIYLIMVAQFQSLKSPFIVMFTIPLAFTGGFVGLYLTGFDVSIVSLIGFVMLCGIVVNNGIVLVDYINQLRIEGMEKKTALIEAGKTRMRPILMTAITTIIGLLGMAFGIGEGTEMMQPVAIVCIGGLLYATIMTLYIVPVLYDLFNKKPMRVVDDSDLEDIDD